MRIEIMDTTLRDGEQTSGVSFVPGEKLIIAKHLLQDVKVDRLEVASARVSEGEKQAVTQICNWAKANGYLEKIEVLGFVDNGISLSWIKECGCQNINLLTKGSLKHCQFQLKKQPLEHISDIKKSLEMAHNMGINVNIYLEDFSNGIIHSPEYVFLMVDSLKDCGIRRFMLPDTLGIMNPLMVLENIKKMVERYPELHFDFHAHNDYDLASGNVYAAIVAGCKGVHTAVNGLGERAGNAPLSSVQAIIKDQLRMDTSINEVKLNDISRMVEQYSGIAIAPNKPIVGESVFTQVAGVHADGDKKNNLYCNDLLPERFGRKREYALGKNSGKANIVKNLEELQLELTPEQTKLVTNRIIELGDKKELVSQEDLPFIISDVLKTNIIDEKVKLVGFNVSKSYHIKSIAAVRLMINDKIYEESASGDGQFDAFVRSIRHIYKNKLNRKFPWLVNYMVNIPPGGRFDALVQTTITWNFNDKTIKTRGLDGDQTEAAIKATIRMLNIIESEYQTLND